MLDMTTNDLYAQCKDGRNSLLWNALAWCKTEIARGNETVKELLQGEDEGVYEDFGFFGTALPSSRCGLAAGLLFDDEDAFIRYEGQYVALVYRSWQEVMTWEERHTAITVEENPRFVSFLGMASIDDFGLTAAEKASIQQFVRWNWRLIRELGTTTDPDSAGFVDAGDFHRRYISRNPLDREFSDISVFAKAGSADSGDGGGETFSVFTGFPCSEHYKAEFALGTPHAYFYSADGTVATRFRIDSPEPPSTAAGLQPLFASDAPIPSSMANLLLDWAKRPPLRMCGEGCRTNWDAMRTAWKDACEVFPV